MILQICKALYALERSAASFISVSIVSSNLILTSTCRWDHGRQEIWGSWFSFLSGTFSEMILQAVSALQYGFPFRIKWIGYEIYFGDTVTDSFGIKQICLNCGSLVLLQAY